LFCFKKIKTYTEFIFTEYVFSILTHWFSYIFSSRGRIQLLGEDRLFSAFIKDSLTTFISYRFENIGFQYISRRIKQGIYPEALDLGSYWYDDTKNKTNGEFDIVLAEEKKLAFYEVKFYEKPMQKELCEKEESQVAAIPKIGAHRLGFICSAGFEFSSDQWELITGEDLFRFNL